MMKQLRLLLAAMLCVVVGSANAAEEETLFLWQSDGSTTAIETNMTATGGTATFHTNAPSTENATYDDSVTDSELKATGQKAHKLGKNACYLQITLSEGYFQAGDMISICGYNSFRVGTSITEDSRASTDIAESLVTGGDKSTYKVGTVKITDNIGEEVNTIYISRTNGSGTGIAAVKITRINAVEGEPLLFISPEAMTLNLGMNETETSDSFSISGVNLTDGTYDLTVPSALSVSPSSITVVDGAVEQEVTVTFSTSGSVNSTTENISLAIGDLSASIAVTYSAAGSLSAISLDKFWDFSDDQWSAYGGSETIIDQLHLAKSMAFDANAKKLDGYEFAKRLKLNGTGSDSQRYIHFMIPGDCVITVYGMSGSNGKVRAANIAVGTFSEVAATLVNDGTAIGKAVYSYTGDATDVWIYSADSGFNIYGISVESPSLSVSLNQYGYATLYYGHKVLEVPAGVTATTYKSDVTISKTYAAGEVIPAGEAVVLEGEENASLSFAVATGSVKDNDANNALRGSDEESETTGDGLFYMLSAKSGKVGFYWGAAEGAAFTSAAHKAYLVVPASAGAKDFYAFDEATGIANELKADAEQVAGTVYNLNGQRVGSGYRGVVIVNGKKMMNK